MKKDIPWFIIEKFFSSKADEKEIAEVETWKNEASENRMIFEQLHSFYKENGWLPVEFIPDTKTALNKINMYMERKSKPAIRLSPVWYRIAAVFITVILTWWLIQQHVSMNKSGQYTILSTNDSTTTNVTLPDGSIVWLNASSTLKYAVDFHANRELQLSGEAYFEVVKSPDHPFVVQTENTMLKVLGTKFNIRSYEMETKTKVSVLEGLVSFGDKRDHIILVKNETGSYNEVTKDLKVFPVDNLNILAWKTREMVFDDQALGEVFQLLGEVYHFTYHFDNENLKQLRITTRFNNLTEKEIFEIISLATNISVTKSNNEYVIHSKQ